MSNERQRKTIPILGTDTSTSDQQVKDGSMQALHNLRYSGGSWRDIKPFKKIFSRGLKPNRISVDYNGNVTAEHRVESDITVTATWTDVDGRHTTNTTVVLRNGEKDAIIPIAYDILVSVSVSPGKDDVFLYYTSSTEGTIGGYKTTDDRIVYRHPSDKENVYIVSRPNDGNTQALLRVEITNTTFNVLSTITPSIGKNVHILHFGRILILSDQESDTMKYYYLLDDIYQEFSYPKAPQTYRLPFCFVDDNPFDNGEREGYSFAKRLSTFDGTEVSTAYKLVDVDSKSFTQPAVDGDYWWGEIALFVAYEMEDGSEVMSSAVDIIASELDHCDSGERFMPWFGRGGSMADKWPNPIPISRNRLVRWYPSLDDETQNIIGLSHVDAPEHNADDPQDSSYYPIGTNTFKIYPRIQIKIDPSIDTTSPIKNIGIYATRINPIWDIQKLIANDQFHNGAQFQFNQFYADNKLMDQPFYLVELISVDQFENGVYIYQLSGSKLEDAIHKTSYTPIDFHRHYFSNSKEYNNRLHISPRTTLFEGFGDGLLMRANTKAEEYTQYTGATLSIDQSTYRTITPTASRIHDAQGDDSVKKILSYPDYRATMLSYIECVGGVYTEKERFALTPSESLNIAYKISTDPGEAIRSEDYSGNPATYYCQYVKYSNTHVANEKTSEVYIPYATIEPNNRLRVSAPNNPLVWPLANTYAIGSGSNKILAINSGAIEMSDAKFGEFPLYVFTEEGIFALQSGSGEILYSSTIPLNYDRIINPNTLAVNYNVLYITSKGLHALYSNGTSLLSEAVNDKNNEPNIEFWEGAQLAYQPKYSEVIIFNNKKDYLGYYRYTKAYVFSLSNKTWSTRDWIPFINYDGEGAYLIGTDKLVDHSATMISLLDINEEVRTEGSTRCSLVSRPIKFESMEFKRIESLIPRIEVSQKTPVHVSIWASTNLVDWFPLREASGDIDNKTMAIRRTPMSARYFRIELSANVEKDIAIDSFDVEYYFRFLHRMR